MKTNTVILCSDLSEPMEDLLSEAAHKIGCYDNGPYHDQSRYKDEAFQLLREIVAQWEEETL